MTGQEWPAYNRKKCLSGFKRPESGKLAILKRRTGAETRELILTTAEQAFSRWGYSATTLDEIAQSVGIKRPSLLYHFPDKLSLFREVLRRFYVELENVHGLKARTDFSSLHEYIDYLLETAVDYYCTRPNYFRIDLHNLLSEDNNTVNPRELASGVIDLWKVALEEGFATGQFQPVSVSHVFAVVGGILSYYVLIPDSVGLINNKLGYDPFDRKNIDAIRRVLRLAVWGVLRGEEPGAASVKSTGKQRAGAVARKK